MNISGKREGTAFDTRLVNGAVKAYLSWDRLQGNADTLVQDIARMTAKMTREEYVEYLKRIR